MPLTDRSQAKDGGFAQVREALKKFKGLVTGCEWGKWGGELIDEKTGLAKPPREFLEITCEDVVILESSEEISMDISELFTFRENCSDYKGSFWVERFLESADKFKILIPDGLVGKIVTWEKVTLEAYDKKGNPKPEFNSTNFIIIGIENAGASKPKTSKPKELVPEGGAVAPPALTDPMVVVQALAIGKTEGELKSAIEIAPALIGTPVHPMAKAGIITQALLGEGKLALVDGKYQLPT